MLVETRHPAFLLGCLCGPVIKWVFSRRCRKVVSRGKEDTRVWYRETMFSQMVSYEFLLDGAVHGYFLYLVCAPPEKPTKRFEPEEGYLRCSKRFDHGSHSIHHYTSLSSSQLHRDFFRFFFFTVVLHFKEANERWG